MCTGSDLIYLNRPGFIGIKNLKVMHVSSKGELVYQRCI